MKRLHSISIIAIATFLTGIIGAHAQLFGGTGTINQLDQWKSDGTHITQNVPSKPIKLTGLESKDCLGTDASGVLQAGTCGSGGGGASWGSITGTLSNQTDLQAALDAKLSLTAWYATTTDGLHEGSTNLYFTTARATANFITNLAATTSVKSIITLPNLSLPYSQLTGTPTIPTKTSDLTNDSGFITNLSSFTTSDLAEGSNLYWTPTRFDNRLSATTSLPNITTLANLGTVKTSLTGMLKAASGVLSTASNGTDFTLITAKTCPGSDFVSAVTAAGVFTCTTPSGTTYTGTFPISVSGSVISFVGLATSTPAVQGNIPYFSGVNTFANVATSSLAVNGSISSSGTLGAQVGGSATTLSLNMANANTWTALQTFANASSTLFSSSYASSTQYFGAGLTTCNGAANALTWNAGVFGCNSISGTGGITAIGPVGQTQTGSTITLATSSTAFNGLTSSTTITGSGNTLTFANTLAGTLGVGAGGTGLINPGSSGANALLEFAGSGGASAISPGAQGTVVQSSSGGGGFTVGALDLARAASITGVLPATNGGTGATSLSSGFSVVSNVLKSNEHHSFTYATTSWTGTTTVPLEVGYGEVWNSVRCFTDVGTVGVDFYHASSHLNYIPTASTTANVNAFTSNNTMTAGDKVSVDLGTPASSPTKITCTEADQF